MSREKQPTIFNYVPKCNDISQTVAKACFLWQIVRRISKVVAKNQIDIDIEKKIWKIN